MIKIRKYLVTEKEYITRTVLMSFLSGYSDNQKINKDSYMKNHNIIINNLLDEHECIVICDEQEPDLVLGFAMYENDSDTDILHYLYVRKGFRGRGLAKILLNELKSKSNNCSISHLTNEFRPARLKSLYDKVIYNPYARIK